MKNRIAPKVEVEISQCKIRTHEYSELIDFDTRFCVQGSEMSASEAPPPLTLDELNTAEAKGDEFFWLLTAGGDRSGYYWTETRDHCLFLSGVVISAKFRNMGIGRQVLHWMDETAKRKNFPRCELAVSPLNFPAMHLYLSHGYRFTKCNPNYFGASSPNIFRAILEKDLNHPLDTQASETIHVLCSDYPKMMDAIKNGYVGTSLVRPNAHSATNTSIVFERKKS